MFNKILVANRGEIARRIFRACRELGVRTVAIYSEVDRTAPWARQADESYLLEGVTARETYLNQELIFRIAAATDADAIHPGYGFLSENPDFAAACEEHGIHFIGPSPEAMRALGSKSGARRLAQQAEVPVIPGVDGAEHDDDALHQAADAMGYPVLIKASAGGGGKGMRVVWESAEFADALHAARNEAESSFGSDHILVEKYFTDIRHVEVQVLGDRHGRIVHLFERECSVQRRHQKIIEESPSPAVSPELRAAMTTAALSLAEAVDYTSAGTLEFVLTPDGEFYFLEMNTRLQVEHPVTELVTGVDLAAWQIRLAAGEPLAFPQRALTQRGHALECRLYAEDPAQGFLPSIGEIEFYRPAAGPGVRVDDGIEAGTQVSPYYDPMLGKIVTWGDDRREAIRKMIRALQDTVILGVTTNIPYLVDILEHPDFVAGKLSTHFLQNEMEPWRPSADTSNSTWLALAAYETMQAGVVGRAQPESGEKIISLDPWAAVGRWRNVE
ncbi:MAG: acetyl-CoA carboxylase biotin carboxylase subunit [Candidatus Promineifilaceae bacterium]|nr:acetyl-CoA carboxylase biotin carboxylase subunit [Candidatus Promineifilaceae bacterium]